VIGEDLNHKLGICKSSLNVWKQRGQLNQNHRFDIDTSEGVSRSRLRRGSRLLSNAFFHDANERGDLRFQVFNPFGVYDDDPGDGVEQKVVKVAEFGVHDFTRLSGGYPTRCHGSVSMWPLGAGGFSNDVNAGKVLKRNILEPLPSVRRSKSFIIESRREAVVVMKGTKKLGKPKWDV